MDSYMKYWMPLKRLMYFLLGNMLYVFAVNMFFLENNIAAGGFAGIATVITSLIPVEVGTIMMIMNIPFLIWSFFLKGWRFTLITSTASFVYSMLLNVFSFLPTVTHNHLLASIFGGLFYAFGAVCILKADASVGGTDLVSRLLITKFRHISLGKMFICVDGFTVIFAIIVFGQVDLGLYAIIAIYVCSTFTDKIIAGFKYASICYVITGNPVEEMSNAIMTRLSRGVTCENAVGMYEKTEKHVLMVVVRPKEIYKLKDIVYEFDSSAFVVIASANEVNGGGFQNRKGRYDRSKKTLPNAAAKASK